MHVHNSKLREPVGCLAEQLVVVFYNSYRTCLCNKTNRRRGLGGEGPPQWQENVSVHFGLASKIWWVIGHIFRLNWPYDIWMNEELNNWRPLELRSSNRLMKRRQPTGSTMVNPHFHKTDLTHRSDTANWIPLWVMNFMMWLCVTLDLITYSLI